MSYVLIVRNPRQGGGLLAIQNDDDSVAEFETEQDANYFANEHPLTQAWGYQIIEVYV